MLSNSTEYKTGKSAEHRENAEAKQQMQAVSDAAKKWNKDFSDPFKAEKGSIETVIMRQTESRRKESRKEHWRSCRSKVVSSREIMSYCYFLLLLLNGILLRNLGTWDLSQELRDFFPKHMHWKFLCLINSSHNDESFPRTGKLNCSLPLTKGLEISLVPSQTAEFRTHDPGGQANCDWRYSVPEGLAFLVSFQNVSIPSPSLFVVHCALSAMSESTYYYFARRVFWT